MGIPIYAPYLGHDKKTVFGKNIFVQAFDLPHDGTDNYGFLIHMDGQRILYMTDFEYCKYKFLNINHMIIECNYQEKYVDSESGSFEHKLRGHCSLSTCKDFIRENNSDMLRTCLLVHLGGETCVGAEIVEEVQKVVRKGLQVDWARCGLDVELKETDCPF